MPDGSFDLEEALPLDRTHLQYPGGLPAQSLVKVCVHKYLDCSSVPHLTVRGLKGSGTHPCNTVICFYVTAFIHSLY